MGTEEDRRLIRIIKKQNAKIAKLERKLALDFGTGVLNKKQGFFELKKTMEVCQRKKIPMTIAFLDVDNLKQINDKYGHCEGDKLLNRIANIIRRNIREYDFVFRYGGDEFIVVFINADIKEAKKIWKRVEGRIYEENIRRRRPYIISISTGFARYTDDLSLQKLIEFADKNMYKNKFARIG